MPEHPMLNDCELAGKSLWHFSDAALSVGEHVTRHSFLPLPCFTVRLLPSRLAQVKASASAIFSPPWVPLMNGEQPVAWNVPGPLISLLMKSR